MNLLDQLTSIEKSALQRLQDGENPEQLRLETLGRKGSLTAILRQLSELPLEERKTISQQANKLKLKLESLFENPTPLKSEFTFDPSVPALPKQFGSQHPISLMIEEMVTIFKALSFEVVEGNEIVTDKENFESLNIDKDHPARDGHDSFFVTNSLLLRTQTTAVQVIEMNKRIRENKMPIRVVVPGKTYRRESDQTHSAMFHQFDAIMVDNQTTFTDLKGIIDYMARQLFGEMVETRFRPHFFPFTEPSAELDIRWKLPSGHTGKQSGWLEMGGCGMIHPAVLKRAGINPRIYQGWAFGMAIERPIMVRKQVPDIRTFFENSLPFLNQFSDEL